MEYIEKECNKRLVEEVAEEMKVTQATVENITGFVASIIARTIRSGGMEGVWIPYLGKFQVKHTAQQYRALLHSLPKELKKTFLQNTYVKDINKIISDETIHTGGGLHSGTEQGMDNADS